MKKGIIILIIVLGVLNILQTLGIVITAQATIIKVLKYENKIENVTRLEIKKEMRTEYLDQIQKAYKMKNHKKVENYLDQWDILKDIEKKLDKEKIE